VYREPTDSTPGPDDGTAFHRRVLSGFAWQGATKVVVQTLSWASTIVAARFLLPTDYGLVAISGVFTEVLALLVELGLSYGLIQKAQTTPEQEDAVFYFSIGVSILAYAVLFAGAPLVARFYGNPLLVLLLRVAGLGLILGSLKGVPLAIAMRRMDFRHRSLVEMAANVTSAVTVVTLAVTGHGVWSLVLGFLAGQTVGVALFLPAFRRVPRPRFSFAPIAGLFGYSMRITVNNLLYYVYSRADVTIIGKLLGEHILGFYSMAFQLATIPLDKIGSIFNQVTFPAMARLQDDPEASRKLFLDLHRHLLILSFPILLGLAIVADDLIVLLLTEKWRPLVPALQGLCLVNLVRVSGILLAPVLNGRGRAGLVLRYSATSAILLPVAFYLGARHGLMGVIAAWALAYPPLYLILVIHCLRDLGLPVAAFLRSGLSATVCAAIMTGAVLLVQHLAGGADLWFRLAASIGTGAATYSAAMFLLFRDEVDRFRKGFAVLRNRPA
jgi:O-antigen/teichoic acid export membrane protein